MQSFQPTASYTAVPHCYGAGEVLARELPVSKACVVTKEIEEGLESGRGGHPNAQVFGQNAMHLTVQVERQLNREIGSNSSYLP